MCSAKCLLKRFSISMFLWSLFAVLKTKKYCKELFPLHLCWKRERVKNIYIVMVLLNRVRKIKIWLFVFLNNPVSIFFPSFFVWQVLHFGECWCFGTRFCVLIFQNIYHNISCEWWIMFWCEFDIQTKIWIYKYYY